MTSLEHHDFSHRRQLNVSFNIILKLAPRNNKGPFMRESTGDKWFPSQRVCSTESIFTAVTSSCKHSPATSFAGKSIRSPHWSKWSGNSLAEAIINDIIWLWKANPVIAIALVMVCIPHEVKPYHDSQHFMINYWLKHTNRLTNLPCMVQLFHFCIIIALHRLNHKRQILDLHKYPSNEVALEEIKEIRYI